jgi:putative hemolysin
MLDHPMMLFIILLILLGMSAFFSGSETALMAISKISLKRLGETKPRRIRIVEQLLDKPERLIGTILLGNNLVNVAMSALAAAFAISLWGEKGIIYVTIVLTLAILVFAEITPKVYAKYYNERLSLFSAPILNVIMKVFNPVVSGVTYISTKILALIGVDVTKVESPLFTEAEIRTCIMLAWDEGNITADERKILSRVFALNDKSVGDIMVPREKMAVIDIDSPVEEVVTVILQTGYSRFPVSKGEKKDIVGFLHAKDVLKLFDEKRQISIQKITRPPYFIPADRTIDYQLRYFQAKRLHQAVVLDSSSHVIGLITLEDILEELVGAITDEHDFT